MELIGKKDIMSLYRSPAPRLVASLAMSLFGINHINKLYEATYNKGDQCAASLLDILRTTYSVDAAELANIPGEGACIIVSNHPTGGMDGVLLIDMLSKVRADVKFMGNFILQRIKSLSQYFIPVDPYRQHDPQGNVRGVKMAADHLLEGGVLVVFPAGEVSRWRKDLGCVADTPWRRSMIRFIRNSGAPVVPLYIEARNSRTFHLLGDLHPFLRTAMLPREFTNKRHKKIPVRIGCPIPANEKTEALSREEFGDMLRGRVYALKNAPVPACDGCDGSKNCE